MLLSAVVGSQRADFEIALHLLAMKLLQSEPAVHGAREARPAVRARREPARKGAPPSCGRRGRDVWRKGRWVEWGGGGATSDAEGGVGVVVEQRVGVLVAERLQPAFEAALAPRRGRRRVEEREGVVRRERIFFGLERLVARSPPGSPRCHLRSTYRLAPTVDWPGRHSLTAEVSI